MSERSQRFPTPEGEYFESSRFAGLSLAPGIDCHCGARALRRRRILNPHQFSYSWLFAFAFFFTLCAGCFFWTIVHHATDADWSVVVRRQLENIAALLVVLAVLFVPILLLRHHLYSWMDIPPRCRSCAGFQTRLSQLAFLSAPRGGVPRVFSFARRSLCAAYR